MSNDAYEYEENELTELNNQKNTAVSPADVLNLMGKIFDYAKEKELTKREIAKYKALQNIFVTKIIEDNKRDILIINKTFEQRKMMIEKHFEVIDKGLEEKNYDLVIAGLHDITAIAKDNPLKFFQTTTFQQQREYLENFSLE